MDTAKINGKCQDRRIFLGELYYNVTIYEIENRNTNLFKVSHRHRQNLKQVDTPQRSLEVYTKNNNDKNVVH